MAAPENLPLLQRLSALGDLARLRILRLLDQEELSVGELGSALQLPQSTVSRHLKLLHDGEWISRRAAGTASLFRVREQTLPPEMRDLWTMARRQLGGAAVIEQDDARLEQVLAERRIDSKSFFGQIGGEWDALRRELFGESFTAEGLLSLIQHAGSAWTIADIGCGTGNAAEQLAPLVKKVIAVDREPAMLEAARKRLAGLKNVEFRKGELGGPSGLGLRANEIDGAVLFLVLIHLESPAEALREIVPSLKPGGFALIVDVAAHNRENYMHTMGHKHLGFDEKQVKSIAKAAGFASDAVRYRKLRPAIDSKGPGLFAALLRKK